MSRCGVAVLLGYVWGLCAPAGGVAGEIAIEVQIEGFNAPEADVRKVLESAAREFGKAFPERKPITVRVANDKGGPIVLYKRGPKGEYLVNLNTGGLLWAQYSYQFAHELCHIHCDYRAGADGNKWFEETLCEVASMWVMRRMSESWEKTPPYPNWKGYATSLAGYVDTRVTMHKLPRDECEDLPAFYRKHAANLPGGKLSESRAIYTTMAIELLPLFEKEPAMWLAVEYLNRPAVDLERSFPDHLRLWELNAPKKLRPAVRSIATRFGFANESSANAK